MNDFDIKCKNYESFIRLLNQEDILDDVNTKYNNKEKSVMSSSINSVNSCFDYVKSTLGQEAYDILTAKYIDKLTHKQIADKFHYSEKTIRRKIHDYKCQCIRLKVNTFKQYAQTANKMIKRVKHLDISIAGYETITQRYTSVNPAIPVSKNNWFFNEFPYKAFDELNKCLCEKQAIDDFLNELERIINKMPIEEQPHLYSLFFLGRSYEIEAERYNCSIHKLFKDVNKALEQHLIYEDVEKLVALYKNIDGIK